MSRQTLVIGLTFTLGLIVGGLAIVLWPAPPPLTPTSHALSFRVPDDRQILDIAISPDHSLLAYTAIADGRTRLFLRPANRFESTEVLGSMGATQPFFAPDGLSIGFFANGFLKTTSIDSDRRSPHTVCAVPGTPAGATWRTDDVIVFAGPGATGLREIPATGGTPVMLTTIDKEVGETAHGWPSVINDRFLLFTVGRRGYDPRLTLLDLETRDTHPLLLADGGGFVVTPSTLVFARRGELFAAPLKLEDPPQGSPSPTPIVNGVASSAIGYHGIGRARFAAAHDGTLVFIPPPADGAGNQLVWVDRAGQAALVDDVIDEHGTPRLSPNGQKVAFSAMSALFQRDLWVYDVSSQHRQQITQDAGDNHSPIWSLSEPTLTFASSRTGLQRLFQITLPGRDTTGPLFGGDLRTPGSWSHDGKSLAFHEIHPSRERDILTWSIERGAEPWRATDYNERAPRFSPDGRWIAYTSDEEGEGNQIYLRSSVGNPLLDQAARVSPIGGTEPVWAKDGGHLFFRRGREFYETTIAGDTPTIGQPQHLFDGVYVNDVLDNLAAYDVTISNNRFLMLRQPHQVRTVHLISGWQSRVFPFPDQ